MENLEILMERYGLSKERIAEIGKEESGRAEFDGYFRAVSEFVGSVCETYEWVKAGGPGGSGLKELKERNLGLYGDILADHYEESYGNPAYAVKVLGKEYGQMLCMLYAELRCLIGFAYEQRLNDLVIRMEVFVEVYHAFRYAGEENGQLPEAEQIRQILYWFLSDNADAAMEWKIGERLTPLSGFGTDIVMNSELNDVRYLYQYGEYVTDNVIRTAEYINGLSEEKILKMADTFTEGYRMGFLMGNKDITTRKSVSIIYSLGFERVIRQAVKNFAALGLRPVIYRNAESILHNRSVIRSGFQGAIPNKQYDYDHKDDVALVMDKQYVNRRLEVIKAAFETHKEEISVFGGPAVMEIFGETPFTPQSKPEALSLSAEQQKLSVEYRSASREIELEYVLQKNRSFTIISFPVPEIGEKFEEIFDEIIRINTLDYKLYQGIQQKLIDALDKAEYVTIQGMNGNRTLLKVMLHKLKNPEKESIFENCVADVNIPVGEVFTSPLLTGTDGVLHVTRVFLNELEYKDLEVRFKDGMIAGYSCGNFEREEDNLKFVKDNLLFNHETLPLGEFAIGTNTTAYVVAEKYGIGDKLPILIAEKMGPHFAVGDTCYSHAEDIAVFNPDGKEIVARDNELVRQKGNPGVTAYYNCHTDITIPYDELGELAAVGADGSKEILVKSGRFVLSGCEELNRPFENR